MKTPSAPAPSPAHDDGSIWNLLGFSAKGKGKDRNPRSPKTTKGKAFSALADVGTSLTTMHDYPLSAVAGFRTTRSTSRASLPEMPSPTSFGPVQQERGPLAVAKTRRRQSLDATSDVPLAPPRKRRKTDITTSTNLQGAPPIGFTRNLRSRPSQSTSPPPTKNATVNGVHQTPTTKISSAELLADKAKGLATRTPPIRRIRLIVRAPEPVYTNPKQRPIPPNFNKSVTSALASFTRLENDDVKEDALEEAARERAALLERVYTLRRQGRMLLSAEDAGRALQVRPTDQRTFGADPWDHVLNAVRSRHRQRETSGPEIAATIAAKVRTYWEAQNAKEGRVRVQQEKQLRVLAKATLKLVITEWKKAVFVSEFFLGARYDRRTTG
jgi:helicase SWR1